MWEIFQFTLDVLAFSGWEQETLPPHLLPPITTSVRIVIFDFHTDFGNYFLGSATDTDRYVFISNVDNPTYLVSESFCSQTQNYITSSSVF